MGNFWIKALRWAFVQSLGSKAKATFDNDIEPYIEKILASQTGQGFNATAIYDSLVKSGVLTTLTSKVMATVKIDPMYESILAGFIGQWAQDAIKAKLGLASKSKLTVSPVVTRK